MKKFIQPLTWMRVVPMSMVAVLVSSTSWSAVNLNSSKSNIYKVNQESILVSASADVTHLPQIIYRTPAGEDFLLTQVCVGSGGILLKIGEMRIVQVSAGDCKTFAPGMVLTPNQPVSCTNTSADRRDTFCTIAGLTIR